MRDPIPFAVAANTKKKQTRTARKKLSIQNDFTLSDEKIGDYYVAMHCILTNIFGRKTVVIFKDFLFFVIIHIVSKL